MRSAISDLGKEGIHQSVLGIFLTFRKLLGEHGGLQVGQALSRYELIIMTMQCTIRQGRITKCRENCPESARFSGCVSQVIVHVQESCVEFLLVASMLRTCSSAHLRMNGTIILPFALACCECPRMKGARNAACKRLRRVEIVAGSSAILSAWTEVEAACRSEAWGRRPRGGENADAVCMKPVRESNSRILIRYM
jgi:hypothetical protein